MMIKRIVSFFIVLFVVFSITFSNTKAVSNQEQIDETKLESQLQKSLDQCFIENKGQWDDNVLFIGKFGSLDIQICKDKIIYIPDASQMNAIELTYKYGSFQDISPLEKMPTIYHYYVGNDPAKWGLNCQTFQKVMVGNIWSNIDLAYFFKDNQLKYEFYIHPGGDIEDIRIHIQGASLAKDGKAITMSNVSGTIFDKDLKVFYQKNKKKLPIELNIDSSTNQISFQWDKKEQTIQDTIVIDPVISASATNLYQGSAVTFKYDPSDNTKKTYYIGSNYFDSSIGRSLPRLVKTTKSYFEQDPTGNLLVIVIGGTEGDTILKSIETDKQGNVYLVGYTSSADLPNHQNTYFGGEWDGFIAVINTKFDSNQPISTNYYGTIYNDSLNDIVYDPAGNIFVAGVKNGSEYPTNQIPSLKESSSILSAPISIYPHAEQVVNPGNVLFQWWNASNEYAVSYYFELKREDDSIAYEDFINENHLFLELNPGIEQRLFWRVRPTTSYFYPDGVASDWIPFTKLAAADSTPHLPEKPILLYPINRYKAVNSSTLLLWSMDNLISGYYCEIEIDNADNPGNPHHFFIGNDDPSEHTIPYGSWLNISTLPFPLQQEMHFLWRIRVKNTIGWSEWSDFGHFSWAQTYSDLVKTDYNIYKPTQPPIAVFPYPDKVFNPTSEEADSYVRFLWKSFDKDSSGLYRLQLVNENYQEILSISTPLEFYDYKLSSSKSEKFYWRVRRENKFGAGPYSVWIPFSKKASFSLAYNPPPEKPNLIYPPQYKQFSGDYFHFYWTPYVELLSDSFIEGNPIIFNSTGAILEIEDLNDPFKVFTYETNENNAQLEYTFTLNRNFLPFDFSSIKQFKWRVRTINHYGLSEWSEYCYFQWNPFSEDACLLRYNLDDDHLLLSNEIPISGNLRDVATTICLDTSFNRRMVGIAGFTTSSDLNVLGKNSQPKNIGSYDGFYHVYDFIDPAHPVCLYSAYLGGSKDDIILNSAFDLYQQIYLVGTTFSNDFPVLGDYKDNTFNGNSDGFLTVIDPQNDFFILSSYFGGFFDDIVFDVAMYGQTIFISGYSQLGDINTRPIYPKTPEECASPWDCNADISGENFFIKMMLKEEVIKYGFNANIPYGAIHFDTKNNRAFCIVNDQDDGYSTTTIEFTTSTKVTFDAEGVLDKYGYGDSINLRVVMKIEGCPVWINGIDVELPDNECITYVTQEPAQLFGCIEGVRTIDYTFLVNCDVDIQKSYPIRFTLNIANMDIIIATTSIVIVPKPKRGDNPHVGLVTRNLVIDPGDGKKYLPYDTELAIDVILSGFDFPINYEVRWGDGEIEKKEKVETEKFTITHKYNVKGEVNVLIIVTDVANRKKESSFSLLIK